MTVRENITYPLHIDGIDPFDKHEQLDLTLKALGLFEKKQIQCQLLSGGEKQRVSIARALASDPTFIIADEPTGNLDRENSLIIADSMIKLHEQGQTILFITHDQRLMDYIKEKHKSTRVVIID
jgi:ABC-type lipoprotein export system ATPase subunit